MALSPQTRSRTSGSDASAKRGSVSTHLLNKKSPRSAKPSSDHSGYSGRGQGFEVVRLLDCDGVTWSLMLRRSAYGDLFVSVGRSDPKQAPELGWFGCFPLHGPLLLLSPDQMKAHWRSLRVRRLAGGGTKIDLSPEPSGRRVKKLASATATRTNSGTRSRPGRSARGRTRYG